MESILKKSHSKRILRILFFLYCIALILLAILPINGESSALNDTYIVNIRLDYFVHMLSFLPFLPFALYVLSETFHIKGIAQKIFVFIIIGILFAITTEVIQLYLPYRTFNINDLIANTLGIILGLPIILLIKRKQTRSLKSKS